MLKKEQNRQGNTKTLPHACMIYFALDLLPKWPTRARRGSKPTSRIFSVRAMKKFMTASATTQLENPSMAWWNPVLMCKQSPSLSPASVEIVCR